MRTAAESTAAEMLEELRSSDLRDPQRVLRTIRTTDDPNEELCDVVSASNGAVAHAIVDLLRILETSVCAEARDVAEDAWYALIAVLDALPTDSKLPKRIVREFGLRDWLEHTLRDLESNSKVYSLALSCILSLKRHGVKLYHKASTLPHDVAGALFKMRYTDASLLLRVLRALALEHEQWNNAISRVIYADIDQWSTERMTFVIPQILELMDPNATPERTSTCFSENWESADISIFVDVIIKTLRSAVSFAKAVILEQLRFEGRPEFTDTFVAHGGIEALIDVLTTEDTEDSHELKESATKALNEIVQFSEVYRKQIVTYQVAHELVEIVRESSAYEALTTFRDAVDYAAFATQLRSRDEVSVRQCLTLLPKNIEILATFCLDYDLIELLTSLLRDPATRDDICVEIWELLVHLIYELPRLGIWRLEESHALAAFALSCLSLEHEAPIRKLAIMYLTAPLNKTRSIRTRLVSDMCAIPMLVGLLAQETDSNIATLLSDLLRDIIREDASFVAELDLVVRGVLDHDDVLTLHGADAHDHAKCKCYFVNLLSLYRRSSACVLGHEALDDVESLELLTDVLENGSAFEKLLALKHLRKYAASWGPIHLTRIRGNIAALASIAVGDDNELKHLALNVLRTVATLDTGCRASVAAAQALFWPNDPNFPLSGSSDGADGVDDRTVGDREDDTVCDTNGDKQDQVADSDGDEEEYVYSDQESGDGAEDGDEEDEAETEEDSEHVAKRQKL